MASFQVVSQFRVGGEGVGVEPGGGDVPALSRHTSKRPRRSRLSVGVAFPARTSANFASNRTSRSAFATHCADG